MDNSNANASPRETPGSSRTGSRRGSRHTTLATASESRDGSRHPYRRMSSTIASAPMTLNWMVYSMLFLRDLLAFFVRGGISTMFFSMDQVLRVLMFISDNLLGPTVSSLLSYPARVVLWTYQIVLWVVYTMIELVFYMHWQVLLVYVAMVIALMLAMPSPFANIFKSLFKTFHSFLNLYKAVFGLVKR